MSDNKKKKNLKIKRDRLGNLGRVGGGTGRSGSKSHNVVTSFLSKQSKNQDSNHSFRESGPSGHDASRSGGGFNTGSATPVSDFMDIG